MSSQVHEYTMEELLENLYGKRRDPREGLEGVRGGGDGVESRSTN